MIRSQSPIMAYITCEGCDESWAWAASDRRAMTFNEWYGFLDDILLGHLADHPLCWSNLVRKQGR